MRYKTTQIEYKCADYKYQLTKKYTIKTNILPLYDIRTPYISLNILGELTIQKGYAWDGCSGPTIDTKENTRAGLFHDALYQLIRWKKLNKRKYRKPVDQFFKKILRLDGFSVWKTRLYYEGVRKFGSSAADPKKRKKIQKAP